jgi:hypothetical protein
VVGGVEWETEMSSLVKQGCEDAVGGYSVPIDWTYSRGVGGNY